MTRGEIKLRIQDGINDPSGVILTDTQLNDLIDEAAEFIVAETRSVKRSAFVSLRPGHIYYDMRAIAPDMMLPYRVWSHSNSTRLTATNMEELDQFQERWSATGAAPHMWFAVSWDIIGLWPASSDGGGTYRVDYFAWPRSLVDDADESEILLSSQDALVLYGQYMGLLKEWDAQRAVSVFRDFAKSEMFAKAKSGVLRIGHRSFGRSDLTLPDAIRTDE